MTNEYSILKESLNQSILFPWTIKLSFYDGLIEAIAEIH